MNLPEPPLLSLEKLHRCVELYAFTDPGMREMAINPRDVANSIAEAIEETNSEKGTQPNKIEADFITRLRAGEADQYIAGRLGYA